MNKATIGLIVIVLVFAGGVIWYNNRKPDTDSK